MIDFGTTLAVALGAGTGSARGFRGQGQRVQADYPASDAGPATGWPRTGLQELRLTRRTRTFERFLHRRHRRPARPRARADRRRSTWTAPPARSRPAQPQRPGIPARRWRAATTARSGWRAPRCTLPRRPDRDGGNASIRLRRRQPARLLRPGRPRAPGAPSSASPAGRSPTRTPSTRPPTPARSGPNSAAHTGAAPAFSPTAFGERTETDRPGDAAGQRRRPRVGEGGLPGAGPAVRLRHREHRRHPDARVGSRVTLAGWARMFNGDYYVSRTRHSFDLTHGYRTHSTWSGRDRSGVMTAARRQRVRRSTSTRR